MEGSRARQRQRAVGEGDGRVHAVVDQRDRTRSGVESVGPAIHRGPHGTVAQGLAAAQCKGAVQTRHIEYGPARHCDARTGRN